MLDAALVRRRRHLPSDRRSALALSLDGGSMSTRMLDAALVRRRRQLPSDRRSALALSLDGGSMSTRLVEPLPAAALALAFSNQLPVVRLNLQLRALPNGTQAARELAASRWVFMWTRWIMFCLRNILIVGNPVHCPPRT